MGRPLLLSRNRSWLNEERERMEHKVILQKLATKYALPIQKVEEAVYYQFKYTACIIKGGSFESVRLPYLGKFHVLPGRLKHLNNYESTTTIKATKV